jgi:hypothetical protein
MNKTDAAVLHLVDSSSWVPSSSWEVEDATDGDNNESHKEPPYCLAVDVDDDAAAVESMSWELLLLH